MIQEIKCVSDQEISNFEENLKYFIGQLPGAVVWKKPDLTFGYTNKLSATLLGYREPEATIGITDHDAKCEAQNFADVFRAQDFESLKNSTPHKSLVVMRYADNCQMISLVEKRILYHPSGVIIGTLSQGIPLDGNVISKIAKVFLEKTPLVNSSNLKLGSYPIDKDVMLKGIKLTSREANCLFYLIRGKTAKEIGRILNISSRTVESHLSKLRVKFHCYSKSQLIELAIGNGYLNVIPSNLLNQKLIKTLMD